MRTSTIISSVVIVLLTISVATAVAHGPAQLPSAAAQTAAGTAFTYQGQLKQGTTSVNGACDFQFGLWDAANTGAPVGITQTLSAINVTNGLFTVSLDFGTNAFPGNARWLAMAVRCPTGSGGYTSLNPRQPITPAPYAMYSIGNWGLSGNGGTSASNFLGTTDNALLTLGVSNTAALRLIPAVDAPIVIGGYAGNAVNGLGDGATIAGGGSFLYGANVISGAIVSYSTIGGGVNNRILGTGYNDTIGGGYNNVISGTFVNRSTIGGGEANTISNNGATVGGGNVNTVGGQEATVSGGLSNIADGDRSTIGGGWGNNILITGTFTLIGGGRLNTASGYADTISGGNLNNASHYGSSIGGGDGNTASADRATIGGGYGNLASGYGATIPGGLSNAAAMSYTLAAGQQAQANHQGTFVWADSTNAPFASTGADQFLIRASGGVGINTTAPERALDVNGVIGVFDGGAVLHGGLATEMSSSLIELGINDGPSNRFGGTFNGLLQGGLFRVDGRDGQDLFQFYGRAPFGLLNPLASLNTAGVLTVNGLGSAGSTSLCYNASHQIATCSSSLRYKNNVENLPLGLETVARLRPVTFNWKTDGASDLGFVAEEVNQVSPLLTTLNNEGQIEGVKYDRISAVLVKAVQEQQQQIAELKKQNTAQQQEIAQLKHNAAPDQAINLFNVISVIALGGVIAIGLRQKRGGAR